MDRTTLDGLAQGRVLRATDALEAGLVDQLGSLDDAIVRAADRVGLDSQDYEVISLQPALSPRQLLLQQLSDNFAVRALLGSAALRDSKTATTLAAALSELAEPLVNQLEFLSSFEDPSDLYMRCMECTRPGVYR